MMLGPNLDHARTAVVLKVGGGRLFARIGKGGRVLTAWSLAGAWTFGPWQEDLLEACEARLTAKGYKVERQLVGFAPFSADAP